MGSSCLEVNMARICVLLCLALVSAISFSGVLAQDITEVKVGDTDNSVSQLTISEGIIRERRSADADKKKKRAGNKKNKSVRGKDEKKRRKNGNRKKLAKTGKKGTDERSKKKRKKGKTSRRSG